MIAKVWPKNMRRGRRGRLANSISDRSARRILADYKRTRSLHKTGALHGRAGATIYGLLRRRGLIAPRPKPDVAAMYADYQGGLSLGKVGKKYGRTRQCVFGLFKDRGLKLRAKEFLPAVIYKGRKYTAQLRSRDRRYTYLRATVGRSKISYLHHVIWVEHHGPIPPGHKVCFRDEDYLNCAPGNLFLLTNDQQQQWRGRKGVNQFTKTAGERLKLLVGNFESGAGTLSAELKARAA